MSLIEVNADLAECTKQLKRIADCLVAYLREAHGLHVEPLEVRPIKDKTEEIMYSDDLSTFKQELQDVHDGRDVFRPIDVDEVY